MKQVVIENPVINSPFAEPKRHFRFESGEAMSADFKQIAAREINDFKADYRRRFPGRDTDVLSDEDLLREVMNTAGKTGKLGEQFRCVVSVSMLTEGWDANTVTHILGVRAFGTQLLCEQVVGRGLRRMSHSTEPRRFPVNGDQVEIEAFPVELEDMAEVFAYVKNHNLAFTIPYTLNGEEHDYHPDFIVRIDDGRGEADLLNLILECTGQKQKDKEAKVTTAQTLWVPAVNHHAGFGRWAFREIEDPWDAKNEILAALKTGKP